MDLKSLSDDKLTKLLKQKEIEESKNDNLQMAMKILLNAGYGAVANENFLYFKIENAESITTTGQLVNRWASERVDKLLQNLTGEKDKRFVHYNDTDSMYFSTRSIVDIICPDETDEDVIADKLDEFEKTVLKPEIVKYTEQMADYLNSYENKMVWEREVIAPHCINVAKKRYCMLVKDSEGVRYKESKLKVTGLEVKRSSTPQWAKKALLECYRLAMTGEESQLQDYIQEFRLEFDKLGISDIATPTGVNNIEKFDDKKGGYVMRTPIGVKASIIHNRLINQMKLNHIPPIQSGNKIKFIRLKTPNPLHEEVVGFHSYLPKEFNLDMWVDRDLIFEKNLLTPLQNFLDAVDWQHEKIISLEDYF